MIGADTLPVVVRDVQQITPLIKLFTLQDPSQHELPAFSGGSHILVSIPTADRVLRNAYSLLNAPADRTSYRIAVRIQTHSRGGSRHLHDRVQPGDTLHITHPVNSFPLEKPAHHHILIAGGVGITPFLAQLHDLARANASFELHYAVRDPEHAELIRPSLRDHASRIRLYLRTAGERITPDTLLADRPLGTHVYVCGPTAMIDEVIASAQKLGWPRSHIHFERFTAPPSGAAFDVFLQRSQRRLHVPAEQSLLETIEAAGIAAPYLCRGGACGQCETEVIAHDGELLHYDVVLSDADKAAGRKILPCVSRAASGCVVLDR